MASQRSKKLRYHLPQCDVDARSPAHLHILSGPCWREPGLLGRDWRLSILLPSAASASNNPVLPKEVKFLRKSRYLADLRHLIGLTCMLVPAIPATYSGPQILPIITNVSCVFFGFPPRKPCHDNDPNPLRISLGTSRFWHDTPCITILPLAWLVVLCCELSKRCPS